MQAEEEEEEQKRNVRVRATRIDVKKGSDHAGRLVQQAVVLVQHDARIRQGSTRDSTSGGSASDDLVLQHRPLEVSSATAGK